MISPPGMIERRSWSGFQRGRANVPDTGLFDLLSGAACRQREQQRDAPRQTMAFQAFLA